MRGFERCLIYELRITICCLGGFAAGSHAVMEALPEKDGRK